MKTGTTAHKGDGGVGADSGTQGMSKGRMTAITKSRRGIFDTLLAKAKYAEFLVDDTGQWSQQRTACRRKQKDTWTP
jgi:hypothetical protein